MSGPVWLIAEREFRAYAATASFWVALAVGPIAMALVLVLVATTTKPPAPSAIQVHADDPRLASAVQAAVLEAGGMEARRYRIVPATQMQAAATVSVSTAPDGAVEALFSADFPLSKVGRKLVARTLERDAALAALKSGSGASGRLTVRELAVAPPPAKFDRASMSRFALVMMLWLTLTGSLGMLLQAVVRERTNRALESLLAAARPWQIVFGKLFGVGAVSLLVLAAWLGSTAVLAPLAPTTGGMAGNLIQGFADPLLLLRAGVIYAAAFVFYGLVTVAVGAAARDTAAAQNLSRPMFAVLLAAFFATLAAVGGNAGQLAWLVYVPPFAPFMLLLEPPGTYNLWTEILALLLIGAGSVIACRLAVRGLSLSNGGKPVRNPARATSAAAG
ncbi:MAG TPA: ABC transporter permease [Caulobacteraceae bacterium]|nr:ABC transporter permease [Caulobacteraceae bacterium]